MGAGRGQEEGTEGGFEQTSGITTGVYILFHKGKLCQGVGKLELLNGLRASDANGTARAANWRSRLGFTLKSNIICSIERGNKVTRRESKYCLPSCVVTLFALFEGVNKQTRPRLFNKIRANGRANFRAVYSTY
jgi:hypothetical protein